MTLIFQRWFGLGSVGCFFWKAHPNNSSFEFQLNYQPDASKPESANLCNFQILIFVFHYLHVVFCHTPRSLTCSPEKNDGTGRRSPFLLGPKTYFYGLLLLHFSESWDISSGMCRISTDCHIVYIIYFHMQISLFNKDMLLDYLNMRILNEFIGTMWTGNSWFRCPYLRICQTIRRCSPKIDSRDGCQSIFFRGFRGSLGPKSKNVSNTFWASHHPNNAIFFFEKIIFSG